MPFRDVYRKQHKSCIFACGMQQLTVVLSYSLLIVRLLLPITLSQFVCRLSGSVHLSVSESTLSLCTTPTRGIPIIHHSYCTCRPRDTIAFSCIVCACVAWVFSGWRLTARVWSRVWSRAEGEVRSSGRNLLVYMYFIQASSCQVQWTIPMFSVYLSVFLCAPKCNSVPELSHW